MDHGDSNSNPVVPKDFDWVLRVILRWIRFIGFGCLRTVRWERKEIKCKCLCILLYSCLVAVAGIVVHVVNYVACINELVENNSFGRYNSESLPKANLVSLGIQALNLSIASVSIHLSFLFVSLTRWNDLCNSLRQIQDQMDLGSQFYRDCSKSILRHSFLVLLVREILHSLSHLYTMTFSSIYIIRMAFSSCSRHSVIIRTTEEVSSNWLYR